jgi:pimeloyl-ACP methyl ester carboxylesterase
MTCGALKVPLDDRDPAGYRLPLQVAAETDRSAPRGVLLVLNGGPGAADVALSPTLMERLGPRVRRAYRIVFIDQRGTGPTALQCPGLQQPETDNLLPSRLSVLLCAQRLGPSRAFYGTDSVVHDLDLLRRALGVGRVSVFAVSYGTFVAQQYALAHPGRVRALALDSVVPSGGQETLQLDVMAAARRVLRSACRAEHCPGDPLADIAEVVAREHNGATLLELLSLTSVLNPAYDSFLPAVHQAAAGDTAELDRIVSLYRDTLRSDPAILSEGLRAAAFCADQPFPWGRSDRPLAGRAVAVRRAAAQHPAADFAPFGRDAAVHNSAVGECLPWPPVRPASVDLHHRLPAVPVLLLAGDRDLATPLEDARAQAARTPDGQVVVVAGAGHVVTASSAVGRRAVARFLLGPATAG